MHVTKQVQEDTGRWRRLLPDVVDDGLGTTRG